MQQDFDFSLSGSYLAPNPNNPPMSHPIIDSILAARDDQNQLEQISQLATSLENMNDDQIDQLLGQLSDFGDELQHTDNPDDPTSTRFANRLDQALQTVVHHWVMREKRQQETLTDAKGSEPASASDSWSQTRLKSIETLYSLVSPESDLRNHLLRWLATSHSADAHDLWTDLICCNPPEHRLGIVLAFAPMMTPQFQPDESRLTRLLHEAAGHSQLAPAIFDLFNFYFRNKRVTVHPAQPRSSQLIGLLGQMVGQLGQIEDGEFPRDLSAHQINQIVSDSVALIVALCDAFSQMKEKRAIPKIHQALQLRHRRVQTEAAAALARLGDEMGKQALIKLAEQPIARLRVLAYAEELNFRNDISLELQGEIAIAEAQLAIWLAEPEQMGLAPTNIELLDNRELSWPSYEHPVQCYLFKYAYGSGKSAHSNIGICGPLVHAFGADMKHLSVDDLYAAFAGWQAEHNEIFLITPHQTAQTFADESRQLQDLLADQKLEETENRSYASFFGELILIASATSENQTGTMIIDGYESTWFDSGNPQAPVDWQMAWLIWQGKRFLNEFNSSEPR